MYSVWAGAIVALMGVASAWLQSGGPYPSAGVPIAVSPPAQGDAEPSPLPARQTTPPPLPPPPQLQTGNQTLLRFVNRHADAVAPRLGADFLVLVPRIETASEVSAVAYVMEDWNEDDAIRNEAMNLLRRSQYEPFETRVLALLERPYEQERIRAFFVQHLGLSLSQATDDLRLRLRDRLVEAAHDRHLAVRREAIAALAEIRDPFVSTALEQGPEAPAWDDMHDLAIYLCHRLDLKHHVASIRALASTDNQQVRVAALYVLGQWRDQNSRALMTAAAASPILQLRRAGEMALRRLTESPH